jgi:hypothetical protein
MRKPDVLLLVTGLLLIGVWMLSPLGTKRTGTSETNAGFVRAPSVKTAWPRSNAAKAVARPAALTDNEDREVALRTFCAELARTSPRAAVEIVEKEFSGPQLELMLREVGKQWAASDFEGALAWAQGCPVPERREALLLDIALVQAERDPQRAAEIVADLISPGPTQEIGALAVLNQWSTTNLAEAAAWANAFPEGWARDAAVFRLGRAAFYQSYRQD